jgi:hypothetical protein
MTSKSARYVRWAKAQRKALVKALGGRCATCQDRGPKFHFHHAEGTRSWVAVKVNRWHRMTLYRRDAERGYLTLLCPKCHLGGAWKES